MLMLYCQATIAVTGGKVAFQLNEADPVVKLSHQPTFGKLEDGAIALNWKIRKTNDGKRSISHTGGSLGFSNIFHLILNHITLMN